MAVTTIRSWGVKSTGAASQYVSINSKTRIRVLVS
jgi:hypothetical protein